MKYLTLLNKLARVEKSYQDNEIIELLKYPFEFEEIPLITKMSRVNYFEELVSDGDLNTFFLNAAIFYLNNIKLIAKKVLNENERKNMFFCINYPDVNLLGLNVPNICISKFEYKESIKNKPKLNLNEMLWLKNSLEELGYIEAFNIVYSKFDDGFGEEVFRIFLLSKE